MKQLLATINQRLSFTYHYLMQMQSVKDHDVRSLTSIYQDTMRQDAALYADISQYFPSGATLENISDENFRRLNTLFNHLFETNESLTQLACQLTAHTTLTQKMKVELDTLHSLRSKIQLQRDALMKAFESINFSEHHPIEEEFHDIAARA